MGVKPARAPGGLPRGIGYHLRDFDDVLATR
jgi:hypothetical protein